MIRYLHHVTATVYDAQEDLDCYAGALGMRLVKQTVAPWVADGLTSIPY